MGISSSRRSGRVDTLRELMRRIRRMRRIGRIIPLPSFIWVVVSNIFLFSPLFGEDCHFDSYFSKGLKPPTSCPPLLPAKVRPTTSSLLPEWFVTSRSIWNRGQALQVVQSCAFCQLKRVYPVCSRMNLTNQFDSTFMTLERATQCPSQCKGTVCVQPSKKVTEWHHCYIKDRLKKIMCCLVRDFQIG